MSPSPLSTHLRRLIGLALPVTAAQLASFTLMVVDLAMLGRVGVEALGAASLGRVWMLGTLVFGMGLLFGLDPIATQAHGAGDRDRVGRALGEGLRLAAWASLPIGLLWCATRPVLEAFGQSPELAAPASAYVLVQIPGLPLFLGFVVLKQVLQAQGVVLAPMWITFAANLFNAAVNWVLIFGHFGVPPLGPTGAGIATSLTHGFLFAALAVWMRRRGHAPPWREAWRRARPQGRREIVHHGSAISLQLGLEMWAFQVATLMAGRLGEVPLAAHTAALTMASTTFMIPLGVSLAAVTRVGNLMGAREPRDAQRAAWVALGLGALVMCLSALAFWLGRWHLPHVFTDDAAAVAVAASILPIAAAFQIFDGLQVVGGGVLRGMGQTRPAALFNFFGYYLLALPLAWLLAFRLDMGVQGIWWGLALGLGAVAVSLLFWIHRHGPARREIAPRLPPAGLDG